VIRGHGSGPKPNKWDLGHWSFVAKRQPEWLQESAGAPQLKAIGLGERVKGTSHQDGHGTK